MIFKSKVLDFPREMCKVDDNTQLIHFNVEVDLYTIHYIKFEVLYNRAWLYETFNTDCRREKIASLKQ